MKKILMALACPLLLLQCQAPSPKEAPLPISSQINQKVISSLQEKYPEANTDLMKRGVTHAASLWREQDGSSSEFEQFCTEHFIGDAEKRAQVFNRISDYMESINGHYNKMSLDLQWNLHINTGTEYDIDRLFGSYSPGSHLSDDLYNNKIAFIIALNFPEYSLEDKIAMGPQWNAREWAYARLGDQFSARVPAEKSQAYATASSQADQYISAYNIFMGNLRNKEGQQLFPEDMVLLSHWNLRDEIKSNYANKEKGLEKQLMIYQVMKRIISQEIPKKVINNGTYLWAPYSNKVTKDGKEVSLPAEPDSRYQQILNNFHALEAMDPYYPELNTYIKRKFSGEMEIPQPEVEALFDEFLKSPVLKEVGALISQRMGRDLEPFDIWYDGFKARSTISEETLNTLTEKRYPNAPALKKDLPRLLKKLGFSPDKAEFIASRIAVDPARGSGHAWGAAMHSEKAHLRTRIPEKGMNYKGYNIAIHEFGHNVEQTISLHDVDYYTMNGVPNTAFTEALAFIFQKRDLMLLDMKDPNPAKEHFLALDACWSLMEIMGVSMVDMRVWKWLYANPQATATELKEAVITISKDVWNQYFTPVFGSQDETILGVYSHMISYPLYLSAYSYGQLIEFQLEQHLKGKDFAKEIERIFSQGRLTPQLWMQRAVGSNISPKPILHASQEALQFFNKQ